jgi:hypothetical protein
MADPKRSDSDIISSADQSDAGIPTKRVNEKDVALSEGHQQTQPKQTRRRVSEWEALQIVAAGDLETIDKEVDEIEADLQTMDIRSTWFKPQLRLKNSRHFTWLLVGMASFIMVEHLYLTNFRFCFNGWTSFWC